MESVSKSLAQKMMNAFKLIGGLEKTGEFKLYNGSVQYNYVEESAVTMAVKRALAESGVFTTVSIEQVIPCSFQVAAKNKSINVTQVSVFVTFVDGETGEVLSVRGAGLGMDSGDKGVNKAITAAVKYALMKTFLIPTGDDLEADFMGKGSPYDETGQLTRTKPKVTKTEQKLKKDTPAVDRDLGETTEIDSQQEREIRSVYLALQSQMASVPLPEFGERMKQLVASDLGLTPEKARDDLLSFFEATNLNPNSHMDILLAGTYALRQHESPLQICSILRK